MAPPARAMANEAGSESEDIEIHRFPDGETLVTLPGNLSGCNVAIISTLQNPDSLALPLRFAAATARDLGARKVGLVAPYLAYMRQDQRFSPGQAVSAPIFAQFLNETFDWLVTADPHLHRIKSLSELFEIPTMCVRTAPLLAEWIASHVPDAVLVGPDDESRQWVEEIAKLAARPMEVLDKERSGDRNVEVSVPQSKALISGTPVIVDDIASSGRTMMATIKRLKEAGTTAPVCIVIHAVFSGTAYDDITSAGAAQIVSTDSIPHATNAISLASSLVDGVLGLTSR